MKQLLRRIRGAIGTGLVWAVSWSISLVTVFGGLLLLSGGALSVGWVGTAVSGAMVGFVSGLCFSAGFSLFNRGKALEDVRMAPTTLLGIATGMLFPATFSIALLTAGAPNAAVAAAVNLVLGAGMGGATAYGLVRIAKSAGRALEVEAPAGALGRDGPTPRIGHGN